MASGWIHRTRRSECRRCFGSDLAPGSAVSLEHFARMVALVSARLCSVTVALRIRLVGSPSDFGPKGILPSSWRLTPDSSAPTYRRGTAVALARRCHSRGNANHGKPQST